MIANYETVEVTEKEVTVDKKLNVLHFIQQIAEDVQGDVDFAYTGGVIDDDDAHAALQRIKGKMEALKYFVNSVR